ncbi:MAG: hypothetical protein ACYC7D_15940 [Nitrososphaerales archaeon]
MVDKKKETKFFLTESMTYATVSTELTGKIRKAYGYERGTVAGLRKKENTSGEFIFTGMMQACFIEKFLVPLRKSFQKYNLKTTQVI